MGNIFKRNKENEIEKSKTFDYKKGTVSLSFKLVNERQMIDFLELLKVAQVELEQEIINQK